ncbi:hypothetical protein EV702DRAFT_1281656 [Suillus placidus]|uniref:Uncharacterized protein n=1 Tax=Suillus placidus TaxID=48579 RepID=A0A9P6ZMN9_9AGAM|nr:hypothetical protein EV702DRAFT_1281656 [Suillus placidus]
MSAARAEWNRLANNTPALEERSSEKDKYLASPDGTSVVPLASTFSRTGTGVGKESERCSVKTTPRRDIGPPEFSTPRTTPSISLRHVYCQNSGPNTFTSVAKFLSSPSLQFGHIREPLILQNIEHVRRQEINKFIKVVDPKDLPSCEHIVALPRRDSSDAADVYHVAINSRRVLRMNGDDVVEQTKKLFWKHLESYPDYEVEFLNAITFGANERIRDFRNTPFPFVDRQCERFLRIYQDLKGKPESTENTVIPAIVWHIARVMTEVEKPRTRYHWGTPENRIYRNVAIPESSRLEIILTLPLFGAYSMYRTRLQGPRFLDEWADFNLLATIFVSANVAFLAVPGIDALQKTASLACIIIIRYDEHHRRGAPRVATPRQGGRTLPGRGKYHIQFHVVVGLLIRSQDSYLYHVRRLGEHVDLTITACFLTGYA